MTRVTDADELELSFHGFKVLHLKKKNCADFLASDSHAITLGDRRIQSDEQLYAAVKATGKVVIFQFKPKNPFELDKPIVLTPEEFEQTWKGD